MCCPFRQMFAALRDFHRTITEVKTNLSDIKGIVNSTSKITQNFENVAGEFKKVVEFYAQESKFALRQQLCSTMSDAGQEELCHQDFLKFIKAKFERHLSELIERHTSSNARVAILTIVTHLTKVVIMLRKDISHEDSLKTNVLNNLEIYFNDSYKMYKRNDAIINDQSSNSINIKLFCDQQNVIEELEEAIKSHLINTRQQPYPDFKDYLLQDLKNRERETKIRKLKQYLSDKIKIKNVGKVYKEEISLHFDIDLKKAEHKVNEVECLVRDYCTEMAGVLQQLPRQRFTEVLEQERVINISCLLKNIIFTNNFSYTKPSNYSNEPHFSKNPQSDQVVLLKSTKANDTLTSQTDINVSVSQNDHINVEISPKNEESVATSSLKTLTAKKGKSQDSIVKVIQKNENSEINSFSEIDVSKFYQIVKKQFLKFDDNRDLQRILEIGKLLIMRTDLYKVVMQNKAAYCQTQAQSNDKDVSLTSSNELYQSTILKNTIIIDPQLILDDLEIVAKPILKHIQETSSKYAIECLENSHVVASGIIDFMGLIEVAIQEHEIDLQSNDNIFLEKIFDLLDCTLDDENARLVKSVLYALTYTKTSRQNFLKRLQESLMKVLFTSAASSDRHAVVNS